MRIHVYDISTGGFRFRLQFDGLLWSTGLQSRKEYTTKKAARKGAKRLIKRMTKVNWAQVKFED